MLILGIALGGAIGSVLRYWLGLLLDPVGRSVSMPIGTISVNIIGSFAIAFFASLTLAEGRFSVPEAWRVVFMVGICGGFTTFSSFSLQTFELIEHGEMTRAVMNVFLSVTLCLLATFAGYLLANNLK
ncbi:fluoride efflux transporter CrcB [Microvirga sp. W0021]|uniref:Fluoride-specific ion channel FluC n=1 Tax=Hohaiivirga grylli TaxID=3133970 RepID=A0ABV0BJ69_9HYPH